MCASPVGKVLKQAPDFIFVWSVQVHELAVVYLSRAYLQVPGDTDPDTTMGDDQHRAGMSECLSKPSLDASGEFFVAFAVRRIADFEVSASCR